MQMSLQQYSLTRFHKPTMDPTRINPPHHDPFLSQDRLSAVNERIHVAPYDKEPMFEKPLTPSDVGKLNRLVVPKQHAEKYFPLAGGGSSGSGEAAGTLLGFEDECGKCWRFRYSYWNSSQSYVLTKGWSRYVKEKSLDAGDVVVFERHRTHPDRLIIGWRRRGAPPPPQQPTAFYYNAQGYGMAQGSSLPLCQADYRRLAPGEGPAKQEEQGGPSATPSNSSSTRLVRLFGVNLECQESASRTTSFPQPIQTQQRPQSQEEAYRNYFNYLGHPPNNHHHHMEMEFGVNQMGNRLG